MFQDWVSAGFDFDIVAADARCALERCVLVRLLLLSRFVDASGTVDEAVELVSACATGESDIERAPGSVDWFL